jgi:hypothetical protein
MSNAATFSSQLRPTTSAISTSFLSSFSNYLPSPVVLLLPVFLFLGEAFLGPIFTFGPSLSG